VDDDGRLIIGELEDLVGFLATEISELRMKCSQYGLRSKEKEHDARERKEYREAARYQGRYEVYMAVETQLKRIMNDYKLGDRQ